MNSRSTSIAVMVLVGLLFVSGCSASADPQGERERGSAAIDPFRSSRTDVFVSSTDVLTTVKSAPTRVIVPDLGIDMQVDPQGLDPDGQMSLPDSIFRAGWYEYASAPNSPGGSTVIAAHVDSRVEGVGPFGALRTAQPGTDVTVIDDAGTTHVYRISSVERLDKGVVPWQNYFTTVGDQRLILVTCGGAFIEEQRNYTDNYIVTAEKVS